MKDEVRTERQQMNKYIQNEHPDNTELIEDPKDIDLEEVLYAYDSERDGSDADDAPEEERPKEEVPEEEKEMVYEVYHPRNYKPREHRLWVRLAKKIGFFLAAVIVLAVIVIFGFRLRQVNIEGNEYYTDEEILNYIHYNDYPKNTLYMFWKNRIPVTEGIPFIQEISVSIQNPSTLRVEVTEKIIVGAVEDNGTYMYFDNVGNIVESSTSAREGVPVVSGLPIEGVITINEKIPVSDDSALDAVLDLALKLQQYQIEADQLIYSSSDGTLSFVKGTVTVNLGSGRNIEDKLTAYNDLKEQPELENGTLHLEDYDATKERIIFSKDSK